MARPSALALATATLLACLAAGRAAAISPDNPYRSFNLSGINYGSMQWERDQRAGRVVWPYYNVPDTRRGVPAVSAGLVSGAGFTRTVAPQPRRAVRRWRR